MNKRKSLTELKKYILKDIEYQKESVELWKDEENPQLVKM